MSFDPLESLIAILAGAPPAEVEAELAAAAARWEELREDDRELAFVLAAGRVEVEVRTSAGRVLGRLPPSAALAVASGASLADVRWRP